MEGIAQEVVQRSVSFREPEKQARAFAAVYVVLCAQTEDEVVPGFVEHDVVEGARRRVSHAVLREGVQERVAGVSGNEPVGVPANPFVDVFPLFPFRRVARREGHGAGFMERAEYLRTRRFSEYAPLKQSDN